MIKTGKRYRDSIRDGRELYIDGEAMAPESNRVLEGDSRDS
jgi:hypothetical protein